MSIYNIGFWKGYIEDLFIRRIEMLHDAIQDRLIPTFDNIEKEAEQVSQKEWDRLGSYSSPDVDPADLAGTAEEAGIDHYLMLSSIKQTLLNTAATTMYHLFEQQVIFFLRREILRPSQENSPKHMNLEEFRDQLLAKGIDIQSFRSWARIDELRTVSNAIKHAEGSSAKKLRTIRPDMFEHPVMRSRPKRKFMRASGHSVYMPMAGDDIFVIEQDLLEYRRVLVDFWNEFVARCSGQKYDLVL